MTRVYIHIHIHIYSVLEANPCMHIDISIDIILAQQIVNENKLDVIYITMESIASSHAQTCSKQIA